MIWFQTRYRDKIYRTTSWSWVASLYLTIHDFLSDNLISHNIKSWFVTPGPSTRRHCEYWFLCALRCLMTWFYAWSSKESPDSLVLFTQLHHTCITAILTSIVVKYCISRVIDSTSKTWAHIKLCRNSTKHDLCQWVSVIQGELKMRPLSQTGEEERGGNGLI